MIKKWTLLLSGLFLGLILSACPVNDLIKSACIKDYPGADYLVLFDSTQVDVQETGLSYVNIHKLYKVFTTEGAKDLRTVTFGYDPLSAYVEIQKVKIHRKCGRVEELDVSTVMDYPAPARMIYWGAREKMIEVGKLEPGDALEVFMFRKGFTYALLAGDEDDDRYIPPMRGHFYDIIEFWSSQPVKEKVYQVFIPDDKFVQYEFYNGEVRSSVVPVGDKIAYTFTKTDIRPIKRESSMVAYSDVLPKLLISTSPDWNAKSAWFYGVNEDFGSFEWTDDIKAKVDEILKDAKDEMDSISLLTHWCADEIRYSGISMGEGEGFTLHKGDMTFTDRCGVCKDKAGMLITMLRAAGFESYAAMTMAGSRIDYIPADQFNHSVTTVKLRNGEYMMLDPTWVPYLRELWSSAEQQQNYLLGVPETADLMITPISPPENHYVKITGDSKISKNGTLTGTITLTAEGQSDGSYRGMFTRYPKHRWMQNFEGEIKGVHPNAKVTGMKWAEDPYNYKAGPIELTVSYEIPDYAVVTDEEIILTPIVATRIFARGMGHLYQNTGIEERKYGFRDRCSRLVELNENISLPAKVNPLIVPVEKAFESGIASFKGGYVIESGSKKISLQETISLSKRIYEADEWPDYRRAVAAQKTFADEPLILEVIN